MEPQYLKEMQENILALEESGAFRGEDVFLFGHCHATEVMADFLLSRNHSVKAILDNNVAKHGKAYKGIQIVPPQSVLQSTEARVCISVRFYEVMKAQLRRLGFQGEIHKVIDYNTYSEYSLSDATLEKKMSRIQSGREIVNQIRNRHGDKFRIFCPFAALGDIYIMMSYLPAFLKKRNVSQCVILVSSGILKEVVNLFGKYLVEVLPQKSLDAAIQAELYMQDDHSFIAHQDRPYVINLHLALYLKLIPLRKIYCAGIFGLPVTTAMSLPSRWQDFHDKRIKEHQSVILSPYAKSVIMLPMELWEMMAQRCAERGLRVFTNVNGEERPVHGTEPICPKLAEMKSAVEIAGVFVGLRSGLCDLIVTAKATKIALYPDYNYSDTQWKAIDMYYLPEFTENIVVENRIEDIVERVMDVIDV